MPTTEERLTALEINDKNIFHQLYEINAEPSHITGFKENEKWKTTNLE